jgi:tetratricopeptide (TPR) repeat protein
MLLTKLKIATAVLLAVVVAAARVGVATLPARAVQLHPPLKAARPGARTVATKEQSKSAKEGGDAASAGQPGVPQAVKPPEGKASDSVNVLMRAKELLKKASEAVNDIQDEAQRAFALMNIAAVQASAGDRPGATKSFEEAVRAADAIQERQNESKKGTTLQFIAKAQAEAGDTDAAIRTATSITTRGVNCRDWALAHIAAAQAKAGDVKGALDTVDLIPADGQPFALMLMATRRIEAKDLKRALDLVEKIQETGSTYKVEALTIVAKAQAAAGDQAASQKTIELARESTKALEDNNQDLNTSRKGHALALIAVAHADMGDLKSALDLGDTLEGSHHHERIKAAVAKANVKKGKLSEALSVVDELGDNIQKGEVLRDIVSVQIKTRDLKAARKTIDAMERSLNKSEAYTEIATAYLKAKDEGNAADAFAEAIQIIAAPAVLYDEHAQLCAGPMDLGLIISRRAAAGDEKGGLEWADQQSSPFVKAVAWAAIADGMLKRRPDTGRSDKGKRD